MFNKKFNSEVFNKNNNQERVSSNFGLVQFEDYNFTSLCESRTIGAIIQTESGTHSLSNIDLETFVSSLIDGGGVVNKKYGNKTITFSMYIEGDSFDDLILRIDDLKSRTQKVEGNLYIKVRGVYRTYIATIQSITVPSLNARNNFIEGIQVSFLITSGIWYEKDLSSEVVDVTGISQKIVQNKGTYEAYPIISLSCKSTGNAMTGITIGIRVLGSVGGFEIYITETIGNNDLIVLDYQKKIVTLNGIPIQFFNPMTPLPVGNNIVDITPTGTANLEATISYNKTYL